MKGYALTYYYKDELVRLFDRATQLVASLPEPPADVTLRCHELARAVFMFLDSHDFELHVIDGYYGNVEHSWIDISKDGWTVAILDCYSIARSPMVQLLDARPSCVGAREIFALFRTGKHRSDIDKKVLRSLTKQMEIGMAISAGVVPADLARQLDASIPAAPSKVLRVGRHCFYERLGDALRAASVVAAAARDPRPRPRPTRRRAARKHKRS